MAAKDTFEQLLREITRVRNKCAWKRQLSMKTLPPYSKEEFQELLTAVEKEDWENLKEELGDVLFHVLLYCEIAKEQKKFNVDDVMGELIAKMKRRNPHVYGSLKCTDPKEIEKIWEKIKRKEKLAKKRSKKLK